MQKRHLSSRSPVDALYPRSADGAQQNDVPVLGSHEADHVPQHGRPHVRPYLEDRTSLFERLETLFVVRRTCEMGRQEPIDK